MDELERPMPPDGWDEENQRWEPGYGPDADPEDSDGFYPLPGESPDPYWFND